MALIDDVKRAGRIDRTKVAIVVAKAGAELDESLHRETRALFASYPPTNLFYKAVVRAAEWAGFVNDRPTWPVDAVRFLETEAPFIKNSYRRGFRASADPIAYLETWVRVFREPKVPAPPNDSRTFNDLVRFHQEAFTALELLDWKRERSWLGPWTSHGAFKIYLIHERRLWRQPLLGAVTLPMGEPPGNTRSRRAGAG